jgi:hypothetical protein
VGDGELEHAVEDEAAAVGSASVEAEHELVEIALQVGLVDRALVGAEKPAPDQRGDPMYSGQQLAGIPQSTVALSNLSDDAPVRIDFTSALDLRRSGFWLRVFVRDARGPVRVWEWRRFRAAGLGRAERRLFAGLPFEGVPARMH